MNTNAKVITLAEWGEIAEVEAVREAWGLDEETPEQVSDMIYGAKFDFVSGSPGYVGELYTLMGDGLSAPPMVLIREDGLLTEAEF